MSLRFASGMFILALLSRAAFAQGELDAVPNRPTVSTTAQPVQRGVLETEWGVDAASSHQDINGLLKFGLTTDFELRLQNVPFMADSGTHGLGDTWIGFKYRFTRDSRRRPSIALMYMFKAPTAAALLGSGEPDHAFTFLASKDLGKHHLDFNLIGTLLGRPGGGYDHEFGNALAWSHPVRGKWSGTAELSGVTSPGAGTQGSAQFIASAIYSPRSSLVFDIGLMGRLAGTLPKAMFIAGVTYSMTDLYRNIHHNDSSQLDVQHGFGLRNTHRIAAFLAPAASQ